MAAAAQHETLSTPSSLSSYVHSIPFPSDIGTAPLLTLSLSKLIENDREEQKRLYDASKAPGFFYLDLRRCGEGEALLRDADRLFEINKAFFDLPLEVKQQFDFASQGSYLGYKGMGAEVVDGKGTKDRNEIYNISKDEVLGIRPMSPVPDILSNNVDLILRYINENNAVLRTLFDSFTTTMNLPDSSSFASHHRLGVRSGCHVRFIRTPPPTTESRGTALGEHTDFGSLTILFNRIGGLQVLLPGTQDWVYVKPIPGCAIINLGDAMVKFSAGLLRSNLHRVVSPPGRQSELVRYSLVYFCRPEHEVVLKRLKGGDVDAVSDQRDDGEGVSAEEWLKRRHMGRKMQYFKGEESWECAKGTEGSRL